MKSLQFFFFSVEFEDVDSTFRIKTLSSIFYIGRGALTWASSLVYHLLPYLLTIVWLLESLHTYQYPNSHHHRQSHFWTTQGPKPSPMAQDPNPGITIESTGKKTIHSNRRLLPTPSDWLQPKTLISNMTYSMINCFTVLSF